MSKQEIQKIIYTLPEDVSIEDVMYRLYVLEKHENAMRDIREGDVFSAKDTRASVLSLG